LKLVLDAVLFLYATGYLEADPLHELFMACLAPCSWRIGRGGVFVQLRLRVHDTKLGEENIALFERGCQDSSQEDAIDKRERKRLGVEGRTAYDKCAVEGGRCWYTRRCFMRCRKGGEGRGKGMGENGL